MPLEDALAWPGPTWLAPRIRGTGIGSCPKSAGGTIPAPTNYPQLAKCGDPNDGTATHYDAITGIILQQGENLGERINYVDGELRRRGRGVSRLVFLGTDCPGLDAAYLEQAALGLQRADAVLGPAGDGGVVLMGARRPWPDLSGLSWSTRDLFAELRGVCLDDGWSVATLDAREDVDTLRDLLGTGTALSGDRRRSRRSFTEWLRAHRGALLAQQTHGAAEARRGAVT